VCVGGALALAAGACEGSLACSTCHVILEPAVYSQLPEPTDEENDMLDLAFGLTETYACRAHLPEGGFGP
jgi:ferredoxin